jgi:RNA polymerase sigma factor (sigma-70 family)
VVTDYETLRDESLMERYRDGDANAFEHLYARHKAPLYRYIRRQCSPRQTADEVFQDVWMRLISARSRYRIDAKFTTYLYRIAHNRLVDYYRSNERTPSSGAEQYEGSELKPQDHVGYAPSPGAGDPEAHLEAQRMKHCVRAALATLPAEQVNAFLLHEEGGLSLEEIATTTGVGRETVKSRLRYALRRLREALDPANQDTSGSAKGGPRGR